MFLSKLEILHQSLYRCLSWLLWTTNCLRSVNTESCPVSMLSFKGIHIKNAQTVECVSSLCCYPHTNLYVYSKSPPDYIYRLHMTTWWDLWMDQSDLSRE